ncbi:MAG: leucine-rich repeat domain-containing protein [Clostridia bacterium]|nr:leucine-rich repeat domain-containing protein [Clostridia bacterium]
MKKFTVILIALIMSLFCLPLFAGCSAFSFSEDFELKYDEEDNPYYVYSLSGWTNKLVGEYTIPSDHDGVPVTEIATQGLIMTRITRLTIPNTVTKIGNAAFAYNYALEEIVFEEGTEIEEIPQGFCGYDRALKSIEIPATVKTIGAMAFLYCEELESATLPEGLVTIGSRAFNYTALKEITIPASVRDVETEEGRICGIGYGAFHTCEKLTVATINAQIAEIPSGAFGYCPALEKIYLPSTLKKIHGALFDEEGKLVYGHAFHYNSSLKDIYFAGTAEQWNAVAVENEPAEVQTAKYDNSAIVNATLHYGNAQ